VHAYHPARRVVEDEVLRSALLSDPARKPRFFSYWAKRQQPHADGLSGGIGERRQK